MTRGAEEDGRAEDQSAPLLEGDDELSVGPLEPGDTRLRLAAPLRRAWRWSGLVAFVTLVAIVVVAVAPHLPRPTPARVTLPYTTLHVSYDVARCLYGFSWSHDSRQIAAFTSYDCASPDFSARGSQSNLYLFDAASGKLTATVNIERSLDSALHAAGLMTDPAAQYDMNIFASEWSPDDHLLAAQFVVFGQDVSVSGVAVVTLTGPQRGHVTALLDAPIRIGQTEPQQSLFVPEPALRWDLVTDAPTTIYLQPALTYRWLPGDTLVAETPLPASASGPAAVSGSTGNAADGQVLSLWRVGYVSLVNATDCNPSPSTAPLSHPYAQLFLSSLAWSPDGRYLLNFYVMARLTTPFPQTQVASVAQLTTCAPGLAPDQIPSVAPHDRGMDAALKRLEPARDINLTLAWSPDGRRLASLTMPHNTFVGSVTIYDCASGKQTHSFTSEQYNSVDVFTGVNSTGGFVQTPLWSPDSAHLLLVIDGIEPQVIVLGPRALGG